LRFRNAVLDAIEAKKYGGRLSEEVIRAVAKGYTGGRCRTTRWPRS
jgi:hypothetical protein